MSVKDCGYRAVGLGFLAAAGASSLFHRYVLAQNSNRPAALVEAGLALATFVLAALGALLLLRGASLHGGRHQGTAQKPGLRQKQREATRERGPGQSRDLS